jgi:hypothetical protein
MTTGSTTPFRPTGTVALAAGAVSASVLLAGGGDTVVVTNTTSALAYVRFGADPGVSASNADMPVLPNARVILSINLLILYAAAALASGSGTVLFTRGDGSYL